jgi:Txe/YoeB family toxin of Txe-Axe toxin-antitoxin module
MECKVKFADEKLKQAFEELKSSDEQLYHEIERALNKISQNAFCGRNVRKRLMPKELVKKYMIDNLWVCNLSDGWRLLYSVGSDKIDVIAVILHWMRHKDYERLFKF